MKISWICFCWFLAAGLTILSAQPAPTVHYPRLVNPSFEGRPQEAAPFLEGWQPCNYTSTPDILPGFWGVTTLPYDGGSYLGLIARNDQTWESLYQLLDAPFLQNYCYRFTVALARSDAYSGYNSPMRLRVWGSNSPNSTAGGQLLAASPTIEHTEWRNYDFSFVANKTWKYIIIECFYREQTLLPYRGNILIDAWSAFIVCDRA
jgi:hypothetical protein